MYQNFLELYWVFLSYLTSNHIWSKGQQFEEYVFYSVLLKMHILFQWLCILQSASFYSDGLRKKQICELSDLPARSLPVRPKAWESPLWGPCTPLSSLPSFEWPLVLIGMGDMAVSNSIGSNVFDILIGLGLPWALQTLAVDYGSYVSAHFPWLLFKSRATWTLLLVALAIVTLSQEKEIGNTDVEGGKNSPHQSPSKIRLVGTVRTQGQCWKTSLKQ